MSLALDEARKAVAVGEVPVGALLIESATGKVLAQAHNLCGQKCDPTAHAELLVLQQVACLKHVPLTLYVTLEPCPMCAGAIVQCRIDTVVYGADDPKAGAVGSVVNVLQNKSLDFRPKEVIAGVMAEECGYVLMEFFKKLR